MQSGCCQSNKKLLKSVLLCRSIDNMIPPKSEEIAPIIPPIMPMLSEPKILQYKIDVSLIKIISIQNIVSECLPKRAKSLPK